MINEHDLNDFVTQALETTGDVALDVKEHEGQTVLDMKNFLHKYTETVAKMLSDKCDKAWYFDAANLIRQTAGIPISVSSDIQMSMKLHPEDDPE
jgi:hypothetical protein